MSNVRAYHPGTEAVVEVPEESMFHLRQSGWLLESEHEANQAAQAASKPAAKGAAKSDEEK